MNEILKSKWLERDSDIVNSEAALKRSAQRARKLASEKNSYVVVYKDGKIVKEPAAKITN